MTHKSIDALLASTMFLLFTMVTPHYEDIAKKIGFVDMAQAQTVATIAPTSTLTTVPTPNPVTGQIIDPTVPAYTPVTSCSNWVETNGGPQGGVYWENLRDFNKHPQIDQYAIQWFNGNWSPWYTPTIGDLDSKINDNGAWRYMISYLQDHNWKTRNCESAAPVAVITPGQTTTTTTTNTTATASTGTVKFVAETQPVKFLTKGTPGVSLYKRKFIARGDVNIYEAKFMPKNTTQDKNPKYQLYLNGNLIAGFYGYTNNDAVNFDLYGTQKVLQGENTIEIIGDLSNYVSSDRFEFENDFIFVNSIGESSYVAVEGMPATGHVTVIEAPYNPSVTVLTPNGGETLIKGQTYRIKWDSQNLSKVYLKLYKGQSVYHDPNFQPESAISLDPVYAGSGYFDWVVPTTIPDGGDYTIKIATGDYGDLSDFSDAPFTITSPATKACTNWKVTTGGPQGGTYWEKLRDFSKHPDIDQYRIQWWNGNWSPWYTPTVGDMDTKVNNDGSWRYLISYLQDHNWETRDCLDNAQKPSVTVLSPNGGEDYKLGDILKIRWKTNNLPKDVGTQVDILDDRITDSSAASLFGTSPVLQYARLVSENGSEYVYEYVIDVPQSFNNSLPSKYKDVFGGNHYTVAVYAANKDQNGSYVKVAEDTSDSKFSLGQSVSSTITLLTPNGGENFPVGGKMAVSWKASSDIPTTNNVRIQFFEKSKGVSFFTIDLGQNDGSENVYIPKNDYYGNALIGGLYDVRIITLSPDKKWDVVDYADSSIGIKAEALSSSCDSTTKPWIEVLSPNGGEVYKIGDTLDIKWESCNYPHSTVDIILEDSTLEKQGFPVGTNSVFIIENVSSKNNLYQWKIPSTFGTGKPISLGNGKVYRINLGDGVNYQANIAVRDKSDTLFTINSSTTNKNSTKNYGVTSADPSSSTSSGQDTTFTRRLVIGKKGDDVTLLQEILIDQGFLKANNPTGYYGPVTSRSVKKLQSANKIQATGVVGPATRALLNSIVDEMSVDGND